MSGFTPFKSTSVFWGSESDSKLGIKQRLAKSISAKPITAKPITAKSITYKPISAKLISAKTILAQLVYLPDW